MSGSPIDFTFPPENEPEIQSFEPQKPLFSPPLDSPRPPVEPKKKKTTDVNQLQEQLRKIQEQLEKISIQEKVKEPPVQVKPLDTLKFTMDSPFVVLPQLSGVMNPLSIGKPGESDRSFVSVGSRAWLLVLDKLRIVGWPYYGDGGIEHFLLKSAWIVWTELNYNVLKIDGGRIKIENSTSFDDLKSKLFTRKFTYVNNIEKFCMLYPDASRQGSRLDKGYQKLIGDIRKQLGPSAFLPRVDKEKEVCPPASKSMQIGELRVNDFLRHWTAKSDKLTYYKDGQIARQAYECRPPASMVYSWIPIEYREKVEEMYNLIRFKYIDSQLYQKLIYNLTNEKELISSLNLKDNDNKNFILVRGEDGMGYRVYLAKMHLNQSSNSSRVGVAKGEHTLREFLIDKLQDFRFYPLIHVILNAPAPPRKSEEFKMYANAGYLYRVFYQGGEHLRMSADAPLRAFRYQLLEQYIKNRPEHGESYDDCFERFCDAIYEDCYSKSIIPDLPSKIPSDYRDLLKQIFDYGGQPEICNPMIPLSDIRQEQPKPKVEVYTQDKLKKMNDEQLSNIANSLMNLIANK